MKNSIIFPILITLLYTCKAFYLPGVAPKDFRANEKVAVFVNALSSPETVLPFDYYYEPFHFCRPAKIEYQSGSLGAILFGDRLYNSDFQLSMLENKQCQQLCQSTIPSEDVSFINSRINERYLLHWEVDGLPVGRNLSSHYTMGFELGAKASSDDSNTNPILFNHYDFRILYHTNIKKGTYRVVGVVVKPKRCRFIQILVIYLS